MIVCICHNVSDKTLRDAIASGADSLHDLKARLNIGNCCGKCLPHAKNIIRESTQEIRCMNDSSDDLINT